VLVHRINHGGYGQYQVLGALPLGGACAPRQPRAGSVGGSIGLRKVLQRCSETIGSER
jgi:hypothetical protein